MKIRCGRAIEQVRAPPYNKEQVLRLYAKRSEMESLVRTDTERYKRAIEAAGGVFGGSEPIQQLVKQFKGPINVATRGGGGGIGNRTSSSQRFARIVPYNISV